MSDLLTKRERKVAECIGESVRLKRECDVGKRRAGEIVEAVEALIQVLDDEETAEQLSSWEEDFYKGDLKQ